MNFPDEFIQNMKKLMGSGYPNFIKSYEKGRVSGIRANTLKIKPQTLAALLGPYAGAGVKWCAEGFYYDEQAFRPAKSPYYHAGLFYIQEPSAMSAAAALPVSEGDKILDMCAAPGGKTTQLSARLGGSGLVVSNDISASRARAIVKNIELAGITNAVVTAESPERLEKYFSGYFDKILIDAPCSGEGMFRKDYRLIGSWSRELINKCMAAQRGLLESAARMLAPGGKILYSTCTFNTDENEGQISRFLEAHEGFRLELIPKLYGFEQGVGLPECARLFPHLLEGEGHFLALISGPGEGGHRAGRCNRPREDKGGDFPEYRAFCTENLNIEPERQVLTQINERLYAVPSGLPDMKGVRILRSGLLIGEISRGRLEPSHALCMSLKMEDFKRSVNFPADDVRLIKYLKGETVDAGGDLTGWCAVCAEGWPVGLARANSGRLKNKYPPSMRME